MKNLLKEGLRRLVERERSRPLGRRNAVVVAVSSLKGGVGKTTTSVNLASALARFHERRVLLVDIDPQGHVARAMSRQLRRSSGTLSDVILDESGADLHDVAAATDVPLLHVVANDPRLADAESLLNARIGKETILRESLRITRTHYDVVLLDCPPNLGNLTLNALVAADRVLIPCDLSPLAMQGVDSLMRSIAQVQARLNPTIDLAGIVLTRVDGRNGSLNEVIATQLRDAYGEAILGTRIGINTDLAKAQHEGRDVYAYAPTSRGAEHHAALAALLARSFPGPVSAA